MRKLKRVKKSEKNKKPILFKVIRFDINKKVTYTYKNDKIVGFCATYTYPEELNENKYN